MSKKKLQFSVVCVFNDREILDKYLMKSLREQNFPYETLMVDNREEMFPSAAGAFNSVLDKVSGEYVIFAHQDILLGGPDMLEKAYGMLESFGNGVVAGVAGKAYGGNWIITNIWHGDPPAYAGKLRARKVENVQTVDECMFIVSKNLLEEYRFDSEVCPGWHLYAVDYCLSVKGRAPVVVLPVEGIYHRSRGASMSDDYYGILRKVAGKHRERTARIYTTCGNWFTGSFLLETQIALKKGRKKIRSWFGISVL